MHEQPTLITSKDFCARELVDCDILAVQRFYAANPDYFMIANGMSVRDDEAQREFDDLPPPEMPFNQLYLIGFYDSHATLIGLTTVYQIFWHPEYGSSVSL
jgi:hypothetical protein